MSKEISTDIHQTNFGAGELDSFIDGRADYAPIYSALKTAENIVILPEGGAYRRKGTRFISPAYAHSTKSRLIPFQYSLSQSYALEFGNLKIRFFKDKSRLVETAKNITAITKANPGVVTSAAHGYSNGELLVLADIGGMVELNGTEVTVANVTTNTYELSGVNTSSYTTYTSGGTSQRVYQITTPFSDSEVFGLKKAQKNDVTYLVHKDHWPQKLIRVGDLSWTIEDVEFQKGPVMDQNIVSTDILTLSGGTWTEGASLTMTASGGHTPFVAGHVGAYYKLANDASDTDTAWVKITAFTSSTVVTVEVLFDTVPVSLRGGAGTFYWNEGAFSTHRGFPRAIAIHEQRLFLAGVTADPGKIWASRTNGDYENFETDSTDVSAAFNIKAASGNQDVIEWLVSDEVLFAGSANTIFRLKASANGGAMSNEDADIKPQSRFGSSALQPVFVGESPFYTERGLTKIRSLGYNVSKDKYSASNATIRSRRITSSGVTQMEYAQNPVSLMLAPRVDGQIANLTLEEEQQVFAWTRSITAGVFESVCVLPSEDSVDTMYFVVQRTVNGATKRYVEALDLSLENDDLNCFYVDSGLTYDGTKSVGLTLSAITGSSVTATAANSSFASSDVGKFIHELGELRGRAEITGYTSGTVVTVKILEDFSAVGLDADAWGIAVNTVSGLDHLEGETVDVFVDGATLPTLEVTSGRVTFAEGTIPGVIIHVGLNFVTTISPMNLDIGFNAPAGTNASAHKKRKLGRGFGKFEETRGGTYSVDGRTKDVLFRSQQDAMGKAVPLFTGYKELNFSSNTERELDLEVIQAEPQPMHLKSITTGVSIVG